MKKTSTASLILLASLLPLDISAANVQEPVLEDIRNQVFENRRAESSQVLEARATALYRIAVREARRARANSKHQESLQHYSGKSRLRFIGQKFFKKDGAREPSFQQGDCYVEVQAKGKVLNVESSVYGKAFNSKDFPFVQDLGPQDLTYTWGSSFYSLELDTKTHQPVAARIYQVDLNSEQQITAVTSCEKLKTDLGE